MATRHDDAGAPAPAATPPANEGAPSFEDAFAAAAAEESPQETTAPPAPAPAAEPTAAEPPAAEPPAAEPPAAEPPAPGGEPPAAEPPAGAPPAAAPAAPAAEPPAAPTGPTAEQIVAQLAEKLGQPAPAAAGAPAVEQPPLYSTEEQQVLTDYEKNWPDVAQAEALKRKGEYHDLLKYVFTQVHGFLEPHLQQISAMGNTLHTQELNAAVPDYTPALEEDVTKWIDTQPTYLQSPMKQVMQTGTSEEVADLIGRYRAATGTAPAPTPTPAPAGQAPAGKAPAATPQTELSPLAKQAAESLAPVSSDRTQVPAGEDTGDYASAFARYAAEEAAAP